MTTTTPAFPWSDVQRHPSKIVKALRTYGRVRLDRRGRTPMFLLDDADQEMNLHAVGAAAALLAALLVGEASFPADAMLRAFPWASVLNDNDRRAMAQELADAGIGGAALGELRAFDIVIRQWRNTAEAKAAGVDLSSPISSGADFGVAKRPGKKAGKRDGKT